MVEATISREDLPEVLVRNFGVVRTQDKGIVPIQLFAWQEDFLEKRKTNSKIVILKSRDVGSSTVAVLDFTARVVLFGGDFLIASYKKESSEFLFETAKLFLENLTEGIKGLYKVDTKNEIVLSNGSHIKAMEMTEKVGRSFRFRYLLATEMAFWENAELSWQALQGAGVKDSEIVVESTPNSMSKNAIAFENLLNNPEFYKLVVDYKANPNHDEKWEAERRKTLSSMQFAQEYECSLAKNAGNLFRREWFEIVEDYPRDCQKTRYWDLAGTTAKESDYTVGVLLGEKDGIYYVIDVKRMKGTPLEVENLIRQTAMLDGNIPIYIEQEPGASGVQAIDHYRREVLKGFDFHEDKKSTNKELRARPVSACAEAGNLKIVKSFWNKDFLDEIEMFPNGLHDDQVDALSGAFEKISFGSVVAV